VQTNSGTEVVVDNTGMNLPVWFDVDWQLNTGDIKHLGYRAYASPGLKALSEGHAAASAFLNNGSDLVAGDGINQAVFAAAEAGLSFFTALSFGNSRYETGSHVDVSGISLLLGGSYGADVSVGRFTVGAFFELGDGTYDTYNDFIGNWAVRGSGDTEYVGGGVLARLDFGKSDSGLTYVEASARAGRVSVDFHSDELGPAYRYDFDSTYYGFHLGVGHVFNLTAFTSLDLYGKWLFTHQGGNDFIAYGQHIRFDDVNSHRLRAGVKISTEITDAVKPYFGLAYEHELDGKARAWVGGHAADVPELEGGSGIGELGLAITASEGLTVDLGVRGYAGARRGVSGTLNLTYSF
jgi:outer membrane autotransporter protein